MTGGSRGIGKAISIGLAKKNINVAVGYNSGQTNAERVCAEIENFGINAIPIFVDLTKKVSIEDAFSKINKLFGQINILINNAAIHIETDYLNISEAEWDEIQAVNIKAPFLITQLVLPDMLKNKYGKIVNIASIAASTGGVKSIPYAASKAGLVNLTKSLARLYSKEGICTFCINPNIVKTDMASNIDIKGAIKSIPANRIGHCEDISKLTSFLCSDDANYLTGQTFNPNGAERLF